MPVHRCISIAFLFALAGLINAQGPAASRWSLGVDMGAGAAYRTLVSTMHAAEHDQHIAWRDDKDRPSLAVGAQAGVGYRLSPLIGLEGGIGYARFGWHQRVHVDELIFGDMIDPRRGSVYATDDLAGLETITFGSSFHYLTARLGVLFTVGQGHWRWSSSVGVAPALLLDARSTTVSTYQSGDRTKEVRSASDPYRDLGLFPYISTGVAYHSGGRWEWSLRPTARYGVLRIIDAPISGHLFSGTVDLGLRYTL